MTKAELRAQYRQARMLLSASEIAERSVAICGLLARRDWQNVRFLHTFLPMENAREPDVLPFVRHVRKVHPSIKLVVGKADTVDFSMRHIRYGPTTELRKNKWGIPEPVGGEPIEEQKLDAVLVPLLVSDRSGNRVGYGKGFYDRFLANCRKDCRKIGVSLFVPIETPIEDIDPYDIPLDELVFPGGIINCAKKQTPGNP